MIRRDCHRSTNDLILPFCLDVPDTQRVYPTLLERGLTTRGKPRIASSGHRVLNLADPNGIRVELMEPVPAAR